VTRDAEWYADGLRFQCTQCGNCCTGPPGVVWIEDDEADAIAGRLGLSAAVFRDRYMRRVNGRWSLKEHLTDFGYDCIFLDRNTVPGKTTCTVHAERPAQCRTWPFWPENLQSPEAWDATKRATPCPGMDTGPLVPVESIRVQRDATPEG
jgi:Fe-S-cluster containining protein